MERKQELKKGGPNTSEKENRSQEKPFNGTKPAIPTKKQECEKKHITNDGRNRSR
jgi:hypothetical protein